MQSLTAPAVAAPVPSVPPEERVGPARGLSIPQVDLRAEYAAIKGEIDTAIAAVVAQTAFIRGPFTAKFEKDWAAYCGASHAVGCANGTAAIELALAALGVGAGDEVITTPMTFIATVEAIVHTGATPVLADVDPATCNLSPETAAAAVTARTRALLPVALYGQPADMAAFRRLAQAHGLLLVEDAAQAQGAAWAGRRTGSDGATDVSTFSFYPGKNLGAYGDAGAVVTADAGVADRARRLADHGRAEKYTHGMVGYNYRLDGLQAAVLSAKLPHLDGWNRARRRLAQRYDALLAPLTERGLLRTVAQAAAAASVYHLYVVRIPGTPAQPARDRARQGQAGASHGPGREAIWAALRDRGVEAQVHYPVPLHRQPALEYLGYAGGRFPEAERAAAEVLSLPLYPLMTEEQQDRVVAALFEAFGV